MSTFGDQRTLGRSGLSVCPLGVAGGYGVDSRSLREAFERGVNYWYHGTFRRDGMAEAARELVRAGQRERLVFVIQSYTRWAPWLEHSFERGLRHLGLDYCDVLLLGWFDRPPSERMMERIERLRERGRFRRLAISAHDRKAFAVLERDPRFDILHVRYNAAHPGAENDVFPSLPTENRPGMVAYTATSWAQLLDDRSLPPGERPLRATDCYRFVLSNPNFHVCMTGPKNAAEMREALSTLDQGPLSPEEDTRVRRIGQIVRATHKPRFR
jgi:aryl-alcohol dehydrogenase-like predicted oxidoreductase